MSAARKGKIRHIGGCCIVNCMHQVCASLRSFLILPGKENDIKIMSKRLECLDKITISYTDVYINLVHAETLDKTSTKLMRKFNKYHMYTEFLKL